MHISSEFVSFLLIFLMHNFNCGFKKLCSEPMVSIHCSYLNGMYVRVCVFVSVSHVVICMPPMVILVLKVEWFASWLDN